MKKFFVLSAVLIALCLCFTACKSHVQVDENTVIIAAGENGYDYTDVTLENYLKHLQDDGKLTFEMDNGMIVSVNGLKNTSNSFWMIYTSDKDNANEEWGVFEYDGATYGSATLGASELKLKQGCTYVLAYQKF